MTVVTELTKALAVLEKLGDDMAEYSAHCVDAREWGGPTIYPRNPINEDRAHRDAKAVRTVVEFLRNALADVAVLDHRGKSDILGQ